jgi:parallel beta-helix repeat protein
MKLFYQIFTKKTILSILIVQCSILSFAKTYYVSNSGNDSNSGLTTILAWKTLAKVNASTFKAGDQILFQKGDTFYGTLTVKNSGSAGNPITYGAYGTGKKPILTGFTNISAWTNLGGNIWESTSAVSSLSTCNMVTINGVNTPMGRYPNTGYLTYQSHSGNTSITSSSLISNPNWTGAEIVLRENHYIINKFPITSQSGSTVTYTSSSGYKVTDGFGFFIQNDSRTLDIANEWYYNSSTKKILIYSTSSPINVQVSTIDTLVHIRSSGNRSYITFDNISFTGSNKNSLDFYGATNINIQDCNFNFSGSNAIEAYLSSYFNIVRSSFNNTNNNAITMTSWNYTPLPTDHILISEDTIRNTAILGGMGKSIDEQTSRCAIYLVGSNSTIKKCVIDSTGYIPIWFAGDSFLVDSNFITNYCFIKDDGGAIWTWNNGNPPNIYTNQRILNNIILNGIGALEGSIPDKFTGASGIYCDNNASNIEISGNTVSNCNRNGILIHDAHEITVKNNTLYNNGFQITLYEDNGANSAVTGDKSGVHLIRNININNNIFLAKTSGQEVLAAVSGFNDIPSFGVIDSNFYARPIDDNLTIEVVNSIPSYTDIIYSLGGWQTYSGFDIHSHKSTIAITTTDDLQFEYNSNNTAKTVTLSRPMTDVKGTKYATSVTLKPFTSVVLMKDLTPVVVPDAPTSVVATAGNASASVTFSAPANNGGSIITGYIVTSIPSGGIDTNAGSTSLNRTITGLTNGMSYYFLVKAINTVGNSSLTAASNSITIATGITNLDDGVKIVVFPNPCHGRFTVRFSETPISESRIEVLSLSGRKVTSQIITGISQTVDLVGQVPGMYFVKSILGSIEKINKLVIQ